MIIAYESKTGFTKEYARMLAEQTGLKALSTSEIAHVENGNDIIFLGWISAGRIKGLSKVINKNNIKAVCAIGLGSKPEPDETTFRKNNKIDGTPFFYLRGGYDPSQIKGFTKILMKLFLIMLKAKKEQTDEIKQSICGVENGCNYVSIENLQPVIDWVGKNV